SPTTPSRSTSPPTGPSAAIAVAIAPPIENPTTTSRSRPIRLTSSPRSRASCSTPFGRVGRQWLEVPARGRAAGEEGLDRPGAGDRRAVQEHEQRAGEVPEQVLEEAHRSRFDPL